MLNGAANFVAIEGDEQRAYEVKLELPAALRVCSSRAAKAEGEMAALGASSSAGTAPASGPGLGCGRGAGS